MKQIFSSYIFRAISLLILLVILISVGTSVFIGTYLESQTKKSVGESLKELAFQMTDKLDRGMFERYKDVTILANIDVIKDPNSSATLKTQYLENLQKSYPNYAWIGITDVKGKVLASTKNLLLNQDVSARDWFKNSQAKPYVGDVHKAVLLANLLPLTPSGEPQRFVDVASPIFDAKGNLIGVLGAHLSWEWSKEVRNSIITDLQQRKNVEMIITNADGSVLLSGEDFKGESVNVQSVKNAVNKENSYLEEKWPDNKTYLVGYNQSTGYESYPGLGWVILVKQEKDIAYKVVRDQITQALILCGALGLVMCLVILYLSLKILKPLKQITEVSDKISKGDTDVKIKVMKGNNEIAKLSRSLSNMISTLRERNELKTENVSLNTLNEKLEVAKDKAEHESEENERLNQFMVGRELEIVKLKKEIEDLKKEKGS